MNRDDATKIVRAYLSTIKLHDPNDECVILEDLTVEKSYGWVFRFNSKVYIETGNFIYAMGGNGPLIVEKGSGQLHKLGSALPSDQSVRQFEEKMGWSM